MDKSNLPTAATPSSVQSTNDSSADKTLSPATTRHDGNHEKKQSKERVHSLRRTGRKRKLLLANFAAEQVIVNNGYVPLPSESQMYQAKALGKMSRNGGVEDEDDSALVAETAAQKEAATTPQRSNTSQGGKRKPLTGVNESTRKKRNHTGGSPPTRTTNKGSGSYIEVHRHTLRSTPK